jgi:hypothetical protein
LNFLLESQQSLGAYSNHESGIIFVLDHKRLILLISSLSKIQGRGPGCNFRHILPLEFVLGVLVVPIMTRVEGRACCVIIGGGRKLDST